MGPIESGDDRRIIPLTGSDIADAVNLSAEAGWNQVAADWAMMLELGRAFGIKDNGRLVASGLALPHPPHFGWISMVLVTKTHRNRGLATALLAHLIAYLTGRDLTAMLDATPQGRSIYLQLGFHDVEPISRWRGAGGGAGVSSMPAAIGIDDIKRSDLAAFGADRSAILADLLSRPQSLALRCDDAFLLSRAGRTATQIGPIIARTAEQAAALLEQAIASVSGQMLIDVPDRESVLRALLVRHGFTVERGFSRMAFGRREAFGDPLQMRAIAGPELG